MPGDLEDLGGGGSSSFADAVADIPDKAELERLRNEVRARVVELQKSMSAARTAAQEASDKAKGATARGAMDEATQLERKADAERARMHALLSELATLEAELKDLERSIKALGDMPRSSTTSSPPPPRTESPRPPPRSSIDDELARLKRHGPTSSSPPRSGGSAPRPQQPGTKPKSTGGLDDELAALKKKMAQQPPKKKP
jgi:hypothetical protein